TPGLIPVKGHILLKGGPAPFPAGMTFKADPVSAVGTQSVPVIVETDGTFIVPLAAGDQALSVASLPEGYSLVSISSGTTDIRTGPLRVQTGVELYLILNADVL